MADAQLPQDDDVRAVLLRNDETFRQLVADHQALDEQIHRLSELSHLTDQQQIEESALKKKKLALKDRIAGIIRGHYAGAARSMPQH